MNLDWAKITSVVILAYLALGISPIFAGEISGEIVVFWFTRPLFIGTLSVGLIVAFGLWQQYNIAWWLGVVATVAQLLRLAEFWFSTPELPLINLVQHGLVLTVLVLLLLPMTRKLCVRPIG